MPHAKIIVEGDFSPWEIAQVIQKIRELDRPDRTVLLGVDAPGFSRGQQEAVFEFLDRAAFMEIVGLFRSYDEEAHHG
jgi:hypothetical protein